MMETCKELSCWMGKTFLTFPCMKFQNRSAAFFKILGRSSTPSIPPVRSPSAVKISAWNRRKLPPASSRLRKIWRLNICWTETFSTCQEAKNRSSPSPAFMPCPRRSMCWMSHPLTWIYRPLKKCGKFYPFSSSRVRLSLLLNTAPII